MHTSLCVSEGGCVCVCVSVSVYVCVCNLYGFMRYVCLYLFVEVFVSFLSTCQFWPVLVYLTVCLSSCLSI